MTTRDSTRQARGLQVTYRASSPRMGEGPHQPSVRGQAGTPERRSPGNRSAVVMVDAERRRPAEGYERGRRMAPYPAMQNSGRLENPGHTRRAEPLAWLWSRPVMPHPRHMLDLALPNLVMSVSLLLVAILGGITLFGFPVWAAVLYVPTVLLAVVSNPLVRTHWRRTSLINLATMAIIFPALVVRQGTIRIPFIDRENGTLLAPTVATLVVVLALVVVGVGCAILSHEDPELSGVAFLPTAMLVPALAGQNGPSGLTGTLLILGIIYLASAMLAVVVSVLPGGYPTLVTPIAIAAEFVALALLRNGSIFPIGAGSMAKSLYFLVIGVTVVLSILIPLASAWVRHVTILAQNADLRLSYR